MLLHNESDQSLENVKGSGQLTSPTASSPIVSVILPTYNRAPLITRAIESVLGQEFTDLELIVVDDGSTDNTRQAISRMDDQRLRYINYDQNHGETFARNRGIQLARGEFIAQMDSDDIWYPQKISYQVNLFSRYRHLNLSFCNMKNINMITGKEENYFEQVSYAFQELQVQKLEDDVWEILGGLSEALLASTIIPHPTVMFRRSMVESVGRYNETLRGAGDFEYWWRVVLKGEKLAYTNRIYLDRYVDAHSLTANKLTVNKRHLQALEICEQTAQDLGRIDLIPRLRKAKFVTWCRIMFEYVYHQNCREAFIAYKQTLKYGSSFDILLHMGKVIIRREKEHVRRLNRRTNKKIG
jgi:glycosyltransferase involved in cell wall biosynthesis